MIREQQLKRTQPTSLKGISLEFTSRSQHYALCLPASRQDYRKALVAGASPARGVILVVAGESTDDELADQVKLAHEAGALAIVAAVDENHRDREQSTRQLLATYGYSDAPVVRIAAIGALRGTPVYEDSVTRLMAELDGAAPPHKGDQEIPFLAPIVDFWGPADGDAMVVVDVRAGTVRIGEPVEIVGVRPTRTSSVKSISRFKKLLDTAQAGDKVELMFPGVRRNDIERGQVIAKPGTVIASQRFDATAYILGPEEGGRLDSFSDGYGPQIYFWRDFTGVFRLPDRTRKILPGEIARFRVELATPLPLRSGMHFAIREGTQSVGVGLVTGGLSDGH